MQKYIDDADTINDVINDNNADLFLLFLQGHQWWLYFYGHSTLTCYRKVRPPSVMRLSTLGEIKSGKWNGFSSELIFCTINKK